MTRDPFSSSPPAAQAGAILTIDLGALVANWRRLREEAGAAECAAVVKADAYGIGIEQAGPALAAAGCRTFFVALLSEAIRLRAVVPSAAIYVLNGFLPGTAPVYAEHDLQPTLGSREELLEWAAFARDTPEAPPAALHIDTGMNRLGLRVDEALALAREPGEASGLRLSLVMSHFCSAEDREDRRNAQQTSVFATVRSVFAASSLMNPSGSPTETRFSLANSSGIFLGEQARHDLVRPGYALYGGNPTPNAPNPMRPVVFLCAKVLQVRDVPEGESVGYNGRWTAGAARRFITISMGYADGFPRIAGAVDGGAGAEAVVGGILCPLAGRVSMDLVTVDVTQVPEEAVKRGDLVEILGENISIDDLGRWAGTIGYEILTSLGRRYHRRYIGP